MNTFAYFSIFGVNLERLSIKLKQTFLMAVRKVARRISNPNGSYDNVQTNMNPKNMNKNLYTVNTVSISG